MPAWASIEYPPARRLDLTEDVLGHQVSDPYRWLEDDTSAERAGWLAAQAELVRLVPRTNCPGGTGWPRRCASC